MQERRFDVALVGAGEMAEGLVRGWRDALDPRRIAVMNRSDGARLEEFRREFGVVAMRDKATVLPRADVVIVAVKPQDMDEALRESAPHLRTGATVLSVAAGVALERCALLLPSGVNLVRAMPNSACRVRQSVTAVCAAPDCAPEAFERVRRLLALVGITVVVDESQFDAVTAVGGSGPAYVYMLVESMLEGARGLGLPEDLARELAVGVILGAGSMLRETALPPEDLRRQVTSPGGTTHAALSVLEEMGVPEAVRRAVAGAAARARELGREA